VHEHDLQTDRQTARRRGGGASGSGGEASKAFAINSSSRAEVPNSADTVFREH
jgi:hypothetical protein